MPFFKKDNCGEVRFFPTLSEFRDILSHQTRESIQDTLKSINCTHDNFAYYTTYVAVLVEFWEKTTIPLQKTLVNGVEVLPFAV